MAMEIRGMKEVISNLNKELDLIDNKTLRGLIRSAIIIRRDMEKTPPLIPVDTGNLRASFFTVTKKGSVSSPNFRSTKDKKVNVGEMSANHSKAISEASSQVNTTKEPTLVLGFSAKYATKVHEDTESHRKKEGSGPFFLSQALQRNRKRIIDLVRREAKIK